MPCLCRHGIARRNHNVIPAISFFPFRNLHKILLELPTSQCKHLASSCATCAPLAPLGPLGRSGLNPRGLLPSATWQMGVTHYPAFGNLRYVHIVVDTCSAFVDVVAMAGEKASHVIKAMKSTILIRGVLWTLVWQ